MKKPSTVLRSLSSRFSRRLAPWPAVAPWPPVRSAYDRWLAAELDELRADPLGPTCASAAWLTCALGLASAAQKQFVVSAPAPAAPGAGIGRKSVDECVDDTADLLDACAGLRDRLELIKGYASSMRIALHWLEGRGERATAARRCAAAAFAECEAVERRCGAELAKCGSNIRKLGERALVHAKEQHPGGWSGHRHEALAGACAAALLAIGALGAALAFRPRRSVVVGVAPAGGKSGVAAWECALQEVHKDVKEEYERRRKEGVPCMAELAAAAAAARAVQRAVASGPQCAQSAVAAARRRCDELEEKVFVLDGKVGELHMELIGVRMILLDWSHRARGHQLLRL
ncbi:hypothetical protein GUJ93_ZPchr0011g27951 [Zizania palustris]|uniref:Uncharacterized protein n=1 Tax=Zizania palustris TaxID=103762 RepID=A0A8J6BMM9_ZIZPA|nr:hypothetical protein GUJ93_ZPchr0011g27951 [Zizania palustris]